MSLWVITVIKLSIFKTFISLWIRKLYHYFTDFLTDFRRYILETVKRKMFMASLHDSIEACDTSLKRFDR